MVFILKWFAEASGPNSGEEEKMHNFTISYTWGLFSQKTLI
jgi:hypothetical protein